MTQHKAFYQMLDDLAVLFDVEKTIGGDLAANALRTITNKSHLPLPRGHDLMPDVIPYRFANTWTWRCR